MVELIQEYRIDLKVRNNVILYRLEKAGYKTIGEVCRVHNKTKYTSSIGKIASMKQSPLNAKGEFIPCIVWLAEILGCSELDLFTDTQLHTILKTNKKYIAVNEAEMKYMLDSSDQKNKLLTEIIEDEQTQKILCDSLLTLTPREQKVLNMRFGMGDYSRQYGLDECGKELGVHRERIRQIEEIALRKLRSPKRCKKLHEMIRNNE